MRATGEVIDFIKGLNKETQLLIKEDADFFQTEISNAVLRNRLELENSWSIYLLSDVDIYYYENMLKFAEKLDMFGIRGFVPPIRTNDKGIAIVYRFSCFDVLGRQMDMVTGMDVGVLQSNGNQKVRKIFVYG